ncbi:hypothetical protein ACH4VR_12730 [Streptomyces sp. NPDC020883]|uniref:hypothetical protein n=1 Tax=Streptomyces sp. NPDC020883 TaxID=3365099 RepID=UPI00379FF803
MSSYAAPEIRALRIDALRDPERVLARWHTHAELIHGGTYDNDRIGLFELDQDGTIRQLTG